MNLSLLVSGRDERDSSDTSDLPAAAPIFRPFRPCCPLLCHERVLPPGDTSVEKRLLLCNTLGQDTAGFVEGVAGLCNVVDSECVRSAAALDTKVTAAAGIGTRGLTHCRTAGFGPRCGHRRAGYGRATGIFNADDSVYVDLVALHQGGGEGNARAA